MRTFMLIGEVVGDKEIRSIAVCLDSEWCGDTLEFSPDTEVSPIETMCLSQEDPDSIKYVDFQDIEVGDSFRVSGEQDKIWLRIEPIVVQERTIVAIDLKNNVGALGQQFAEGGLVKTTVNITTRPA